MYYVISLSMDGIFMSEYTKDQLLTWLNEQSGYDKNDFLDKMPTDPCTEYWGDGIIIIKGKLVVPKVIRKVIEVDIE